MNIYNSHINNGYVPSHKNVAFSSVHDLTPEDEVQIGKIYKKLTQIDLNDRFIPETTKLKELNQKIIDLFKIGKYVKSNPILAPFFYEKDVGAYVINYLYNFFSSDVTLEERQESFDEIIDFASNPDNSMLTDKLGEKALDDVLYFNELPMSQFTKTSIKNARLIFNTPELQPIVSNLDSETTAKFIKNYINTDENTQIIKNVIDLISQPKYNSLANGILKPAIFNYKGDLKNLFDKLLEELKSLNSDEKFNIIFNSINSDITFKKVKNLPSGQKLVKQDYYDADLNLKETVKIISDYDADGRQIVDAKLKDFVNNSEYHIKKIRIDDDWQLLSNIKIERDETGKIVGKEFIKKSARDGVLNIKRVDANGHITTKSGTSKNGDTVNITKRLVSPLGTTTEFDYIKNQKSQNSNFDYVIKDKDGKILAERHMKCIKFPDNISIWTINGERYTVRPKEDKILIEKFGEKGSLCLNLKEIIKNKNNDKSKDKELINMLLSLPATELIKIASNVKSFTLLSERLNGFIDYVSLNVKTSNDLFVMLHELGHSKRKPNKSYTEAMKKHQFLSFIKDNKMLNDKKLNELYEKEKQKFVEKTPRYINNFADYFINEPESGLNEIIAETNALINTPQFCEGLTPRSHYLQENFPETIAYIVNNYL